MVLFSFLISLNLWMALELQPNASDFMIVKEKRVTVVGNTSWGAFTCNITLTNRLDTLFLGTGRRSLAFTMPVVDFGCGNYFLNKDFQSTLKAEDYPRISVRVLSLNKTEGQYFGQIWLRIAGKEATIKEVRFQEISENQEDQLQARLTLKLSQFELVPPKKMGGLLTVDDHIQITVRLLLN